MKTISNTRALRFPLIAATIAFIQTGLSMAADVQPNLIKQTQYAGGDRVAVRWETSNTRGSCTGLDQNDQRSSEYAVFARQLGEEFEFVWDLRDTSDRVWYGSVPELGPDTPVELQIRQKDFATDSYCNNPLDTIALVDVTDIDNPPSFDHSGDVLINDAQLRQLEPGARIEFKLEDWASSISDNDGGTQLLLSNHVYNTPVGLFALNQTVDGAPGTTLSIRDIGNGANNTAFRDGFSVLQVCNIAKTDDIFLSEWVGACSEEVPVIISAGPNAPGANNAPSFTLQKNLDVGLDYSMQEHLHWANIISAGDNATANSNLIYHVIWVTNSALFEVSPWISTPSGSLRFKFKEGVSGTSRVYVALADWDVTSPDNRTINFNSDLPADHSMIKYVELSVGDGNGVVRSGGSTGQRISIINDQNPAVSTSSGGGGALGLLSLVLVMTGFRNRRK